MQAMFKGFRVLEGLQKKISFSSLSSVETLTSSSSLRFYNCGVYRTPGREVLMKPGGILSRFITTGNSISEVTGADSVTSNVLDGGPRIKFKRLDKTARNIMQILDREAVQEVKENREVAREIADIKPGYIIQLKVEVPENKRRVSTLKGIVIARRNAGLHSTFRIRRLVAGVGVESVFPLYSPNIKELKILEKKKVRRAKLYYLRDKMNALKKQTSRS
ncbi:hypothetical protein ACHQM5_029004 [Ranunculus cassubicifolius]